MILTMQQEELKNKIIDLAENSKNMTANNAVEYIKTCFPEDEYKWGKINERSDFYIDNRDIIYLSNKNQTQLIISYPGGDRLGSSLSDPHIDIYFHNPIQGKTNNFDVGLYLFREDKYNSKNNILENIDVLIQDYEMSVADIVSVLEDSWQSVPYKILEQVNREHLNDAQIVQAIVNCVKCVAESKASDAYDQYMYGQYGGEDVADWRLSISSQFNMEWGELPELVKSACHDELEKTWLMLEDTKQLFSIKQKELVKQINDITKLSDNKEKYIQDIHDRYRLLEKHDAFFKSSYAVGANKYSLNIISDMHTDLNHIEPAVLLDVYKQDLKNIESKIGGLIGEIASLEQANAALMKKRFYFWQRAKKQDAMHQIAENNEEIAGNKGLISTLQKDKEEIQHSMNLANAFLKDVEEMSIANPMDGLPSLFWHYELLELEETTLSNYSEADYIDMLNQKIERKVFKLDDLNEELASTKEILDKIHVLNEKTIETNVEKSGLDAAILSASSKVQKGNNQNNKELSL